MAQNFLTCDREQSLLLPPDLRDLLNEDHLAWFVIEADEELDLAAFYADYRADGRGRAAHDPAMVVTLVLYAYAVGERSARGIERRCSDCVVDLDRQPACRSPRRGAHSGRRCRERSDQPLPYRTEILWSRRKT